MGQTSGKSDQPVKKSLTSQATSKREKGATKLLGMDSLENLKSDWLAVKGIAYTKENGRVIPANGFDVTKSEINRAEFTKLMNHEMRPKDIEALFNLYDYNHDGSISWREYVCVIALIMGGTTKEKVKLIFNCFDEDRSGTLSREEFNHAATRFCDLQSPELFTERIFKECDENGDGSVSLKEFTNWVNRNHQDFEKFVGVLNILPPSESST